MLKIMRLGRKPGWWKIAGGGAMLLGVMMYCTRQRYRAAQNERGVPRQAIAESTVVRPVASGSR